jgi:hypothetical protein
MLLDRFCRTSKAQGALLDSVRLEVDAVAANVLFREVEETVRDF